jgi:hypothetical protein
VQNDWAVAAGEIEDGRGPCCCYGCPCCYTRGSCC